MAMLVYGGAGAWAAALETPETKPASEVTGTTVTLHGVLNPQNAGDPGTYEFLFKASATECEGSQTTPTGTALGHKEEAVSAGVTQLLPFTQYTFCLLARNEAQETALGSPVTFTTPAVAPTVAEQSVANVGSTTATLSASIDPGGAATTYHVEYGTSLPYASNTTEVSLPASTTPVSVQEKLAGLAPGALYHFRFVATNARGTVPGKDATLTTTQAAGASELTLPDNRTYELVSPPNGDDVYLPETTNLVYNLPEARHENQFSHFPFRASADGNAVAYNAAAPPTGGNGLRIANGLGNQFIAMRGPHGWAATDILPSPPAADELQQREEYQAFSSDLSVGILFSTEGNKRGLPLAPGASACDGLYTRTAADGGFHALFTVTPIPTPNVCAHDTFAGASSDGLHVLFETNVALTPEAEPAEGEGQENLYESVGEQLTSINVLDGKPVPNATFGSEFKSIFTPEDAAQQFTDFDNVISADGSRVFWTDLNTHRVYMREDGTTTVPVSPGEAQFWTATPDGRYAFYTEGEQLWRFDADSMTREPLTPGGGEAEVRGVVGASADGAYVYFVAGGALAEGTTRRACKPIFAQEAEVEAAFNENRIDKQEERDRLTALHVENAEDLEGKTPPTTGCTLYVRHAGHTTQVATLSPDDDSLPKSVTEEGQFGDWLPNLGGRTAQVTPDGHGVVFESRQRLTGYDNLIAGSAAVEAFVYNADSARLSCVSCNPSGAAPTRRQLGVAGEEALLPRSALAETVSTYTLRWISEDGSRVFFETDQQLVSQDTNGRADVYEWEREGTPSCPRESSERKDGGCVFLLGSGDGSGSLFVDASANGDDVFFATRAKLVPGDDNESMKLYDARVDGGFPDPSLACTGTGCQGVPPGPPQFATPSSATFGGTGNFAPVPVAKQRHLTRTQKLAQALKACRKRKIKSRRVSCERHARRLYAPAHKARKPTRPRDGRRHP